MDIKNISKWLLENYSFNLSSVISLLRSYTNDVFLVELPDKKYVLKIYGKNWRTEDEINYEVELLKYLHAKGLLVAEAIPGVNSQSVNKIKTSLGTQLVVLYEYAQGEKPQKPFTEELYFLFGETIGKMHKLSDNFVSQYHRRDLNLDYLVNEPLVIVKPLLNDNPDQLSSIIEIADKVKKKITKLNKQGLDWGPIHGDATLDNLHVTKNKKIVLYDFDSGGLGWRASDLQGWAVGNQERQQHYEAFIKGYKSSKQLNEQDIKASPYLDIAWEIWGLKVDLENRILKQGHKAVTDYLNKQMQTIRDKFDLVNSIDTD